MGTEKLRGGRPPRIFNDPDSEFYKDSEMILKAWESAKPKCLLKTGKVIVFGTGGDINTGKGFKKIWDET